MIAIATLAISIAAACGSSKSSNNGGGGTAITGTVRVDNGSGGVAAAGATVQAVGGPSTTTAADGTYTLLLTSNSTEVIRATASGAPSFESKIVVPPGGMQLDFGMPSNGQVAAVAGILGATFDPAKGIVAVDFIGVTGTGYGVSLSAASGGSFTFGSGGAPQPGAATVTTNNAQVIFYNVDAGTTTVTVTPPTGTCQDVFGVSSYPVDANTITGIAFFCQ